MRGPSGPTLSFQIAAIAAEGVGPQGPPTVRQNLGLKAVAHLRQASA
ncbi:DUF6053 domain-containing protein [Lysobacter enzymogenes]